MSQNVIKGEYLNPLGAAVEYPHSGISPAAKIFGGVLFILAGIYGLYDAQKSEDMEGKVVGKTVSVNKVQIIIGSIAMLAGLYYLVSGLSGLRKTKKP